MVLARFVWQAAFWLYLMTLRRQNWSLYQQRDEQTGRCRSWALVTGATDGIGLGFAKVLAEAGWSIVLLSRSSEKLASVQAALAAAYPQIGVDVFVWDIGAGNEDAATSRRRLDALLAMLEGRDLGLLVNNVGVLDAVFGWFGDEQGMWPAGTEGLEAETAATLRLLRINCVFSSRLTHALLPRLLARPQRSGIVNLSSILAQCPSPYSPVYGASKAYNRAFSRSLSAEYCDRGVDVLCVSPGMVASQLTGLKSSTLVATDPKATAVIALNALGAAVEVFPHPVHGATMVPLLVAQLLPARWQVVLAGLALRFLPKPPAVRVSNRW